MPKKTVELFLDWIIAMEKRWIRLNVKGRVVQQSFGPVNIRMDAAGITMTKWGHPLCFYEQARKFIKDTIVDARHEAAKTQVKIFESELHRDLAESEFMCEEEAK